MLLKRVNFIKFFQGKRKVNFFMSFVHDGGTCIMYDNTHCENCEITGLLELAYQWSKSQLYNDI